MKNHERALLAVLLLAGPAGAQAPAAHAAPAADPGELRKVTMERLLLADATRVGNRVIAVGDRGYIVYSDDNGATWKRAKSPAAPRLTSVDFVDSKHGWAVGQE